MLFHRTMRVPVLGVVQARGERLELRLYARAPTRLLAVVRGSTGYVLLALAAVGLGAPPAVATRGLVKHRHRASSALVREEPANGHTKRLR